MKIQELVNGIFRQNFRDQLVLGRTLFGGATLVIGFEDLFNVGNYASYAPDYVPFPEFFAVFVGIIFVLSGFLILANTHIRKATAILIALLFLFIIVVYLPVGDMHSLIEAIALIGGALVIRALPIEKKEEVSELP